jgi:hypothetical protein
LLFAGKQVCDGARLEESHVRRNSTLHLCRKLRG